MHETPIVNVQLYSYTQVLLIVMYVDGYLAYMYINLIIIYSTMYRLIYTYSRTLKKYKNTIYVLLLYKHININKI